MKERRPWLTKEELKEITGGLTQRAAQKRHLAKAGIPFTTVNGQLLVMLQDLSPVRHFNDRPRRPKKLGD